jgi:hypothetical protein
MMRIDRFPMFDNELTVYAKTKIMAGGITAYRVLRNIVSQRGEGVYCGTVLGATG